MYCIKIGFTLLALHLLWKIKFVLLVSCVDGERQAEGTDTSHKRNSRSSDSHHKNEDASDSHEEDASVRMP